MGDAVHHCRERYYPQIAPCIIVAIRPMIRSSSPSIPAIVTVSIRYCRIRRSGRNPRAGGRAGSDGESGIKVKNLRYVTSQPWPFLSL